MGTAAAAATKPRYRTPELIAGPTGDAEASAPKLQFDNSPSDMVLQAYARETSRTLLYAPDAPKASISLRSQTPLNRREYLLAIQTVLRMNNIALLPVGEKFLKVVPASAVLANAIPTGFQEPESGLLEDRGEIVSQMIQLRYISIDEASKAIASFKRGEGQLQVFERTNSILLTDRTENVNRMIEIIRFLDQPRPAREEVNVRTIRYAKAANVKQRLDEIVKESQNNTTGKATPQSNAAGAPGIRSVSSPIPLPTPIPGVVRAPAATPANNPIVEALMAEAERGVIRGKVQILADERTNILIIITQPENMAFFERIINVLDIETTPDVIVTVLRLEYADAEEVAKMLNDLIGNVKAEQPKGTASAAGAGATTSATGEAKPAASTPLADFAERLRAPAAVGEPGKSKVGELSKDNIKLLSNKRTNAVIIMASKSDTAALREIITDMDIMLSQVLIETVVMEVKLNDNIKTGIDWLQQFRTSEKGNRPDWMNPFSYFGSGGGGSTPIPNGDLKAFAAATITNALSATSAAEGFLYYLGLGGIGVNAVIQASSEDSRTKILTSPVLLTQDNKEASIESTDLFYIFKGYTYTGTTTTQGTGLDRQSNVDQQNVGITVKITPRINQRGLVVLHVTETFQDAIPNAQTIDGTPWPSISTRKLSADVSVKSGETVILGGLVKSTKTKASNGIPLLKDIPFIGRYLFGSTSDTDTRTEVLVFLTPHVLDTAESMEAEARRRKNYLNSNETWTKDWSGSKLADETIVQKIKRERAENAAQRAQENAHLTSGIMSVPISTNIVSPAVP